MTGPRITHLDDMEWREIRPQVHRGRKVALHQKSIERADARSILYTHYGPGLVLEKHSHKANEVIHILKGELMVGEVRCTPGTTIVLETGTAFGPLIAGDDGCLLFEVFDGAPGHISEDFEGFQRICEEQGITVMPEEHPDVPAMGSR